jgi:1-acyl-sn-glycerol-3-phosphate acyltransferase
MLRLVRLAGGAATTYCCRVDDAATTAPDTGPRRDAWAWRLLATGLSFAVFGLVGFLLGLFAVPVLIAIPAGSGSRRRRIRRLVRGAFRAFIGFMRSMRVLTYELQGFERLGRPGQLVVANHPSLIDVVFLIAFIPHAGCVVKRALWRNPAMALVVRAAGYVPNWPTDAMIERAADALAGGQCLIMFPEGTRTQPGLPRQFHRGAATVAIRAASTVTPVFVSVQPTTLTKHAPWYRIPRRRPHFSLAVGVDIDPALLRDSMPAPRAARTLNEGLLAVYAGRLGGR